MSEKNYKTAFYIMTAVVILLLGFFVGMRFIENKSQENSEFYSELAEITSTTESETEDTIFYININTASAFELTSLPGIGETKANAIVEYRNEYGDFTDIIELLNVKGIGEAILEQIAPFIKIND